MMILYAATSNPGKLAEFATSASTQGITVLPLPNLIDMPEPVEDAPTFQGNADLKAIAYSLLAPGLLVFADDSGLEVQALHNQPGVRSARFADDQNFQPDAQLSKDARNNNLVLHLMQHQPSRTARFVCNLSLAHNGEILLRAEGAAEGQLLNAPRGQDGFGYDPLFLIPSLNLTFAELPREQKWELSHRGNAFRSLLAQLPSIAR
ncbi:MAG: non-canonical purine NTP pyrophosphatase [Acidobacteriaceae bacterium]